MSKRKFDVKLRKVGNSYVVTIPKDTVDRFKLQEGNFLAIELDTEKIKGEKLHRKRTRPKAGALKVNIARTRFPIS